MNNNTSQIFTPISINPNAIVVSRYRSELEIFTLDGKLFRMEIKFEGKKLAKSDTRKMVVTSVTPVKGTEFWNSHGMYSIHNFYGARGREVRYGTYANMLAELVRWKWINGTFISSVEKRHNIPADSWDGKRYSVAERDGWDEIRRTAISAEIALLLPGMDREITDAMVKHGAPAF